MTPEVLTPKARPFFTVKQLAELLNVAERTAYSLLYSGAIPSYKIAGSRRIDPQDVSRYLRQCREDICNEGERDGQAA